MTILGKCGVYEEYGKECKGLLRGCFWNAAQNTHTYEKRVERVSGLAAFTHIMSDGVYCIWDTLSGVYLGWMDGWRGGCRIRIVGPQWMKGGGKEYKL